MEEVLKYRWITTDHQFGRCNVELESPIEYIDEEGTWQARIKLVFLEIHTEIAEHVVKLHNENLKKRTF